MSLTNHFFYSRPWRFRFKERRTLLIIGDLTAAILAFTIALWYWASSERFIGFSIDFLQRRVPPWFFLFPIVWMILLIELYDIYRAGNWKHTIKGVATAALIGFGLYLILYFYYSDPPRSLLPRRGVAGFLVGASLFTLLWRWIYIRVFTAPQFMRRVLIVGGGIAGSLMVEVYKKLWPPPFFLAGIIDDDPEKISSSIEGYSILGSSSDLLEIVNDHEISDIIVAISGHMESGMFQALIKLQEKGVEITRVPKIYEELLNRVPVQVLEADWIIRSFVDENRVSGFYELSKRIMDLLGAMVGIAILFFLFPFITLAIFLDDGRPIFYNQTRCKKGDINYSIIKFRTMRRDAEANGLPQWAKEDDTRATRIGRVLRKTHLDELPQFINILRGDMSLVGPRAERPELVNVFESRIPFYRARLLVKPGLTGWAQVNFGYAETIEETTTKLEYDLFYIKNRSLWLDLLILLRTPATVMGFRGR